MGEFLFILSLITFLICPFIIAGLWWWVGCMSIIGLVVVFFEAYCRYFSKEQMTISQMFWRWSVKNKGKAWIILGLLQIGWLSLLLHLAWKMMIS